MVVMDLPSFNFIETTHFDISISVWFSFNLRTRGYKWE